MTEAERKALIGWLSGDDTGMSSKTLAREFAGEAMRGERSYPSDSADLGRCVRLIDLIPGVRRAVDSLAAKSVYWKALAPEWDRLAALYREERASGRCPKTYDAMKAILNPIEDADSKVIRMSPGVTMRFGS